MRNKSKLLQGTNRDTIKTDVNSLFTHLDYRNGLLHTIKRYLWSKKVQLAQTQQFNWKIEKKNNKKKNMAV